VHFPVSVMSLLSPVQKISATECLFFDSTESMTSQFNIKISLVQNLD